jgi:two-component system, response regulator RegA
MARPPAYAVVDLRLEDGNGLDVVEAIRERRPDSRVVVLTGYGAIATAVAAVKIGATDYLSKPADANDVTATRSSRRRMLCRPRPTTRCRPTVCAGSISSGSTNSATAT